MHRSPPRALGSRTRGKWPQLRPALLAAPLAEPASLVRAELRCHTRYKSCPRPEFGSRNWCRTWLLGMVMHVHGLYADTPRPCHPRQAHVGASEQPAQALEFHFTGHAGILLQKRPRLHHDARAGFQFALKDIAVAVQQSQSRTAGGDKTVHEHALAA